MKNTPKDASTEVTQPGNSIPPGITGGSNTTDNTETASNTEPAGSGGRNGHTITSGYTDEEQPEPKGAQSFNLDTIRLRQDFAADVSVKKVLATVPVRKPGKQDFVRVHPGEAYRLQVGLLILEDSDETYVATPSIAAILGPDVTPRLLVTTVNRQGVVALWPLAMPDEEGRLHDWGRSALHAAELAKSRWVRLRSNKSLGAYEVEEAAMSLPEPAWPAMSFAEIVSIAFRGRIIDTVDHPVIRALKGAL